jgi:hypothetical protein
MESAMDVSLGKARLGLVGAVLLLAGGCLPPGSGPGFDSGGGTGPGGPGPNGGGTGPGGPGSQPDGGTGALVDGAVQGAVDGAVIDGVGGDGYGTPTASATACMPPAPFGVRLLAPLSGSTVTSARPRLRWLHAAGATGATEVQVCADRGCAQVIAQFTNFGSEAAPPADLPPGYWFWRARTAGTPDNSWTAPWLFRVRRRFAGYAPVANTAVEPFSDVNGDGYPDVAVAGVYLGGPDGIAADRIAPMGGTFYQGPGVDVNGDGFTDFASTLSLAVAGQGWPNTVALIGFGSSYGFTRRDATVTLFTTYAPLWVGDPFGVGDFDGDGFGEMVVQSRYGGYLLRGCAPGPPAVPWGGLTCGNCQLQQIAPGDFNGDGRTDLIFADGSGLNVYVGNANGPTPLRFPGSSSATVIDFNYDGYSDLLVIADWGTGALQGHEGSAAGLSGAPSAAAQPHAFQLVGDFDGDGYWDVVGSLCASGCSDANVVVGYTGPGGWGAPFTRTSPLDRLLNGQTTAVVDLNADGYDDLLLGGPGDSAYYAGSPAGLASTPTKIVVAR